MILPLYPGGAFGEATSLGVAVVTGVAFGVALERAGLGSSRKIAAQFYGTDFTVIKVMFTAIVVAMLGLFVLSKLGVLDPAGLSVPETWLVPQLAGGIVFGAGLIVGGLCPGTSCVAAASGHLDGLALMAGLLAGTLVFEEAFPLLARFYDATPMGRSTLPSLLGLPGGAVVGMVTAAACLCFVALRRHEKSAGAA
jgi:hypothetical protein